MKKNCLFYLIYFVQCITWGMTPEFKKIDTIDQALVTFQTNPHDAISGIQQLISAQKITAPTALTQLCSALPKSNEASIYHDENLIKLLEEVAISPKETPICAASLFTTLIHKVAPNALEMNVYLPSLCLLYTQYPGALDSSNVALFHKQLIIGYLVYESKKEIPTIQAAYEHFFQTYKSLIATAINHKDLYLYDLYTTFLQHPMEKNTRSLADKQSIVNTIKTFMAQGISPNTIYKEKTLLEHLVTHIDDLENNYDFKKIIDACVQKNICQKVLVNTFNYLALSLCNNKDADKKYIYLNYLAYIKSNAINLTANTALKTHINTLLLDIYNNKYSDPDHNTLVAIVNNAEILGANKELLSMLSKKYHLNICTIL